SGKANGPRLSSVTLHALKSNFPRLQYLVVRFESDRRTGLSLRKLRIENLNFFSLRTGHCSKVVRKPARSSEDLFAVAVVLRNFPMYCRPLVECRIQVPKPLNKHFLNGVPRDKKCIRLINGNYTPQ